MPASLAGATTVTSITFWRPVDRSSPSRRSTAQAHIASIVNSLDGLLVLVRAKSSATRDTRDLVELCYGGACVRFVSGQDLFRGGARVAYRQLGLLAHRNHYSAADRLEESFMNCPRLLAIVSRRGALTLMSVLLAGGVLAGSTPLNVITWNIKINDNSESHARTAMDLLLATAPQPEVIVICSRGPAGPGRARSRHTARRTTGMECVRHAVVPGHRHLHHPHAHEQQFDALSFPGLLDFSAGGPAGRDRCRN